MTAHMWCYLWKLHSINSVVLHNHMLKTFFSLIRHHWFSTLIQEQKNYITIYHLPSALCCSPIRSMRFLLSLLFSLMVYPPNSNTLPTTWGENCIGTTYILQGIFCFYIEPVTSINCSNILHLINILFPSISM